MTKEKYLKVKEESKRECWSYSLMLFCLLNYTIIFALMIKIWTPIPLIIGLLVSIFLVWKLNNSYNLYRKVLRYPKKHKLED